MKPYVHFKDLYVGIYSNFISNSPKLKATQMSFHSWVDKQILEYSHNVTLFSHKKEWTFVTYNNMDSFKIIILNETRQNDSVINDSIYIKILEKADSSIVT